MPRMHCREAAFKIDVLIVGGGISGLACAYALGRSGHRVRVLEKTDGNLRGAGVRMPPNLTKILVEWGLEDELKKCQPCRKTTFISYDNGDTLGVLEWQEDVLEEAGGQFLLIRYDDLYKMLRNLALFAGATISYDSTVSAVESAPTPCVHVNGTILTADLIIGADGGKSLLREFVTKEEDTGTNGGHTFYTVFIPIEQVASMDSRLAKWAHAPQWPIVMGDDRCALGFPTRTDYCFTVVWPDAEVPGASDVPEGWDTCPTSMLDLSEYDRTRRLFNLAPTAQRAKYVYRDRIQDWVDHSGRVVLVGEAAHPSIPHSTHGVSMAIEDAEALGVLMSHLSSPEQIPQLTEGFQELRQKRCDFIHFGEMSNWAFSMMPPGEERDSRNALLRESLKTGIEHWDDGMLREQWEQIEAGFAYHMREAAEDWWMKWGSLGNGVKSNGVVPIKIGISSASVNGKC